MDKLRILKTVFMFGVRVGMSMRRQHKWDTAHIEMMWDKYLRNSSSIKQFLQ